MNPHESVPKLHLHLVMEQHLQVLNCQPDAFSHEPLMLALSLLKHNIQVALLLPQLLPIWQQAVHLLL